MIPTTTVQDWPWTYFSLSPPPPLPAMPQYLTVSRLTGLTCLTNSQAATHDSYLMRWYLCALGFRCEQSAQLPKRQTPLCQWNHVEQISTQALVKNHHPSLTVGHVLVGQGRHVWQQLSIRAGLWDASVALSHSRTLGFSNEQYRWY